MSVRAKIERALSPGLGFCYRCERPWKSYKKKKIGPMSYQQMHRLRFYGLVGVDNHATSYGDEGHGCFPLCEGCWNKLTPEERLPYYRYLWELWKSTESEIPDYKVVEWSVIEKAVLSE